MRIAAAKLARSSTGFTLVELLVVIGIIMLLIAIGVPAGIAIQKQVAHQSSLATVATLTTGCRLYQDDFDYYPPSNNEVDTHLPNWDGGQLLYLLLTGYAQNPGTKGTPTSEIQIDDGKDGFGFRIEQRGRVYGPYNGAEGIEAFRNGNSAPYFADAFENPILYYRCLYDEDTDTYSYNGGDNSAVSAPTNINSYSQNKSDEYYRTDFSMCSQGADDNWTPYTDMDKSDDVTNFFD